MAANYKNVNEVWPENAPKPSPQEALDGARKLVRLAYKVGAVDGRPFTPRKRKFVLTSGRRHTWPRRGIWYVNPDRSWGFSGWKEIVHGISHAVARNIYPGAKPHDPRHAFLERTLAEHVVSSGWLEGKLRREAKPKAPPVDRKTVRQQRIAAKIKRWQSKKKRAETALKKLNRQRRYYDRQAAAT
jgi:hypothetical protein